MPSSPQTMSPPISKGFYGWIALTGTTLSAFAGYGLFVLSYGVFLPVMSDEFGWSRAAVGLGMSLGLLCFGLPSPLVGLSVARFGARINLTLGNLVGALGLASMFLAHEIWQVYLCYSIAGLGCCFGGAISATTVANSWFIRKRSLAVGIIMGSAGVGGLIFPLVITALLNSIGWRVSWLVLGGILFLVGSLIGSWILVRNKPEELGQMPDGVLPAPPAQTKASHSASEIGEDSKKWTVRKAFSHPTIWLIIACGASSGFVTGTIMSHQVAYLRDLGANPMVAASTLSVIAACGIIGSLGSGFLAMKIHVRHLIIVCLVIRAVALAILLTTQNITFIYLYAVLFGISNGMLMTLMFTIIATYYGRASFARIQGTVFAFTVVLQSAGPTIAGAIHDNTGTYTPAFMILGVLTIIGIICAFLARPPKLPQSVKASVGV
jgi:MFS family permease